jgi:hypothetical protein
MKTPREFLLGRHQTAASKLDAMRHEVISRLSSPGIFAKLWLELIWPCRRIWTGLAAVWGLVLLVNFCQTFGDTSPTRLASSPPTAEMILALQKQEKMLNELLADRSPAAEATLPRRFVPKPRSETCQVAAV